VSRWQIPLTVVWEGEPAAALPGQLALARVRRERRVGLLTDAFAVPSYARRIVAAMAQGLSLEIPTWEIRFELTPERRAGLTLPDKADIQWLSAEQSNSSLIIGEAVMLKIFRRVSAGEHPEAEMSSYLTRCGFANSPPLLGVITRIAQDGTRYALAVAQGFVRNQGDAWSWFTDYLNRALDAAASPGASTEVEADHILDYETMAAAIGHRLGEMHAVLARPTDDPAFAPAVATAADAARWRDRAREQLIAALDVIATHHWERPDDQEHVVWLQKRGDHIAAALSSLAQAGEGALICRIHGDFHLGQVLVASGDAYIIDFEGEPARPLGERRAKTSPLRDVAGLLRSFDYLVATVLDRSNIGSASTPNQRRDEMVARFGVTAPQAFSRAYAEARGAEHGGNERLLDLFLIEKAAYELLYDAANRPSWLSIPLGGLTALARRILAVVPGDHHGET
jgi:maltose alpha-D-glucosyltransferase / alpha-amylase